MCSFRREKYVPDGGPDGGDGGDGGSVYFEVDEGLNTLDRLPTQTQISVPKDGEEGGKRNCRGKNGADIVSESSGRNRDQRSNHRKSHCRYVR